MRVTVSGSVGDAIGCVVYEGRAPSVSAAVVWIASDWFAVGPGVTISGASEKFGIGPPDRLVYV